LGDITMGQRVTRGSLPDQAQQRLLALCAVATELGGCKNQEELFRGVGRLLHRLGLDSVVYLLTPDRQALRVAYVSSDEFSPDELDRFRALTNFEKRLDQFSVDSVCTLTNVLRDGRVRYIRNMLDDLECLRPEIAGYREELEALFPTWQAMYVPLVSAGAIIGVLVIHSLALSEVDIPSLVAFANLLGAVLESVRRQEAEGRQNELLDLLAFVVAKIASAPLSWRELAIAVTRSLASHSTYENVFLGFVQSGELRLYTESDEAGARQSLDSVGVLSRVARTGKAVLLNDGREAPSDWDPAFSVGTGSILAVPLLGGVEGDEPAGVLCVTTERREAFGEDDQRLLETVASNVIVAWHRVHLFQRSDQKLARRMAELRTLIDIGQSVTRNLNPDELLRDVLRLATDALDAEQSRLLQVVGEGQRVRIAAVIGLPEDTVVGREGPLDETLLEWAMQRQEPLCIPDTSEAGWYSKIIAERWIDRPRSILVAPLNRAGETIGGLALTNKRHGTFDDADIRLIDSISMWAAQALENAMLYQASREKRAHLDQAVTQIGTALIGGYTLKETVQIIVDLAVSLIGADYGNARLLTPDGRRLQLVAASNIPSALLVDYIAVNGTVLGRILENGSSVSVIDARSDPLFDGEERARRLDIRSFAGIPMCDRDRPIGVLALSRKRVDPFTEAQMTLLQSFASHAAVAIQHARLADEISESAHFLDSILQQTSDAILVLDASGNIEFANATAGRLFKEVLGRGQRLSVPSYLADAGDAAYIQQMWARLVASDLTPFEVQVTDLSGALRDYAIRPSVLTPGKRFLLVVRDITNQARLDRLRHELLRDLHHQLSTPLSSVLGFTQLLLNRDRLSAEQQQICVEGASTEAGRVNSIIGDLLTYALLIEPPAHATEARADLEEILGKLTSELQGDLAPAMEVQGVAGVPPIAMHRSQLLYAVRLLITCLARLAGQGRTMARVEIRARTNGSKVEITFRTPTVGLPPDQLRRVLDSAQASIDELTSEYVDCGLGLALVRRVVEIADGGLQVLESEEAGTVLGLTLPAAREVKS